MSRKPKKSALELLAQYEREVELLADPAAVRTESAKLQNEMEGTLALTAEGELDHATHPTQMAPEANAVVAELTFEPGIALCLSGTGYRGMLFQAGVLARMNELGLLTKLERIVSVSTGSIVAALLGLRWNKLAFDDGGRSTDFAEQIIAPLRGLASKTIDTPRGSGLVNLFLRGEAPDLLARAYAKYLFGGATLQDLPDRPRFVIEATNMQSGATWRFSKPYMGDYRVGQVPSPSVPLATAVAASSAFSPLHTPVRLRLSETQFVPGSGTDLQRAPFTTNVLLTDGSIRDSLAVEPAWNRYSTILVSDGGVSPQADPFTDRQIGLMQIFRKTLRLNELVYGQIASLYRRQVINSFTSGLRAGAYWGLRSSIDDYNLNDALPVKQEAAFELGQVQGRLARLSPDIQERLMNWGYAISDAGLRRHLDSALPPASRFPYPENAL